MFLKMRLTTTVELVEQNYWDRDPYGWMGLAEVGFGDLRRTPSSLGKSMLNVEDVTHFPTPSSDRAGS